MNLRLKEVDGLAYVILYSRIPSNWVCSLTSNWGAATGAKDSVAVRKDGANGS